MATAISAKLAATVFACVDLDTLYPASAFQGLVAFDIYVVKGEVSTGQKVSLASQFAKQEMTIKGIEMMSDPADTNKVRILCSKPMTIKIPLLNNGGWTISED